MSIWKLAATAVTVTVVSTPALAGISDDLKFCAGLTSSKERLACYDAAARIENAAKPTPARTPASTAVQRQPSPLDAQAAIVTKAPIAPPRNWQGFYLGANGGWARGDTGGTEGWLAGAHAGYNAQSGQIVVGLVIDAAFADIKRSETVIVPTFRPFGPPSNTITTTDTKIDFLGTARAKLGFDFGDFLLYGTGGLAWLQNSASVSTILTDNSFSSVFADKKFHFGYAAGAGLEARIAQDWSLFAEYLYINVQPQTYALGTFGGTSISGSFHVARGGVSYWFR